MPKNNMIDPDTIGQMVVEGLEIINAHTDGDDFDLKVWLTKENKTGNALRPLRQLADAAHAFLDDGSILNDPQKQLRVLVAYGAISGLLSVYGVEA